MPRIKTTKLALRNGAALLLLVACATSSGLPDRQSERYHSQQLSVVIRSEQGRVEEVEVHGLLGSQVLTVHGDALTHRPDGTFEVDLAKASQPMPASAAASLLSRRGVKAILFDRVGDVALRARLMGAVNPATEEEILILNRASGREPASGALQHPAYRESVGSLRD